MSPVAISLIVFACAFGGALLGLLVRSILPSHHLGADSKDVVKLGSGLVGTMAALVLGLLVASAKGSYDTQSAELTQLSANVVLLDRVLAHYGPETDEARRGLRGAVAQMVDRVWPKDGTTSAASESPAGEGEILHDQIATLSPKDDRQRTLQAQALSLAIGLGQTRWLMYEQQSGTAVSMPLLTVLVLWLTAIFLGFGVFAPPNGTVIASLCISALAVSCAIFLILEMYTPYAGLIQISSAPVRASLAHLGQ